jgi:CBS domain containing-hemolysin-like protein
MNDDRSRLDPASPNGSAAESPREHWFDRLLNVFHLRQRDQTREELEEALDEIGSDATFSARERAMLRNVLAFHRMRVADVMVPRADIVAVASDTTLGDLLATFRTAGHSRVPVYGETLDDPRGMVHIRDFLDYLSDRAETGGARRRRSKTGEPVPSLGNIDLAAKLGSMRILRPVLFVPPSMPAVDLLVRMQATRTHMALVIDEYGGTDGLVSIEDLVEAVVGDIEDEHDDATARMIVPADEDTFVADARASLEEVSEALGLDLAVGEVAEEVDTIGGLVVTLAGRVPSRGELIAGPNALEFEVLDADPRRLKKVRIYRHSARVEEGEAPEAPAAAPNGAEAAGAPPGPTPRPSLPAQEPGPPAP